jgi:uncharacterized membrane protein (Fun14 family)
VPDPDLSVETMATPPPPETRLLPGMAIISLWMLLEAAIGAIAVFKGVFTGPNRNGVLGIATILVGCGLGLIQRRRWGWALSLATSFFSLCFGIFAMSRLHLAQFGVMTFLNAVFFLYLIRPEVRARLR